MSGEPRKKQVKRHKSIFRESEVKKLFGKLENSNLNVKFAYKRGTFYIVDAFKTDTTNPFNSSETSLEGIRISNGKIEGTIGKDIVLADTPKLNNERPLISGKGGYTSTAAQTARNNDIPAIFRYRGELKERQQVFCEPRSVDIEQKNNTQQQPDFGARQNSSSRRQNQQFESQQNNQRRQSQQQQRQRDRNSPEIDEINATEVLALNAGRGLYLQPPFRGRYAVTESRAENAIHPDSFLKSFGDIFSHEGDKAIIDGRNLDRNGVENAIDYLDAELKILVMNRPDERFIRKAVESGFEAIAVNPGALDQTKKTVAKAEKKFIMEKLREL
jgi:hypothetical protein